MGAIAGIVDLTGTRPAPVDALQRMSAAMAHRGDHEALYSRSQVALAERSHDAIARPDIELPPYVVLHGAIFNADELQKALDATTSDDASLLRELWQTHREACFDRLRGQFAAAIWDEAARRLLLVRDHFGVSPLHWSRQGDWLLFASEIKGLLASGMVPARVDLRGIHHVWTFFGVPGPVTCFEAVSALLPGHALDVRLAAGTQAADIQDTAYWKMSFPEVAAVSDRSEADLIDEYESILLQCVEQRLRRDPRPVIYSSGGLDSSLLVSMAAKLRGEPLESFTFRVEHPHLDETSKAADVALHVGSQPEVVELTGRDLVEAFCPLVRAAESPVIDVSAAALMRLAERVRAGGYHAVLTGEGADEFQAGYPWFRIQARLDRLDRLTHLPLGWRGFRAYVRWVHSTGMPWSFAARAYDAVGGRNAWLLAYILMATAKHRFLRRETLDAIEDHLPFEDLQLDHAGLKRWHPLNRSIYLGTRIHLTGLHLAARGDRAAGRSGVEPRYPFLDRDVFDFLASLDPAWKLRGVEDKYLQRRLADRWVPRAVSAGRKKLLHAPLDAYHRAAPPAWVEQLLSQESLQQAGYFDPNAVAYWRGAIHGMRDGFRKLFIEMGLVGVLSTQLWHQQFVDTTLADMP